MKNTVLFLFITSIFLTGSVFAQGGAVATAQKPVSNAPRQGDDTVKGYMFGPGDEITGKVGFEPDYNFVAVVDENGRIEVPFSDKPVMVQCKTEREVRSELTDLLKRDLRNPQLNLQTTKRSRPLTSIYGAVVNAARVDLIHRATLMELIVAAGGTTDQASGLVQVYRVQTPPCTDETDANKWKAESGDAGEIPSKIYTLSALSLGNQESNPVILPGDIIEVQKAAPAYITGEVIAPQAIFLKERGTTLQEALSMISGTTPTAKTKEIKIYRLKPGSSPSSRDRGEPILVNFELIKAGKAKDVLLQPYDIVQVDKAKKPLALTILEFAAGMGKQAVQSAANSTGSRLIYY